MDYSSLVAIPEALKALFDLAKSLKSGSTTKADIDSELTSELEKLKASIIEFEKISEVAEIWKDIHNRSQQLLYNDFRRTFQKSERHILQLEDTKLSREEKNDIYSTYQAEIVNVFKTDYQTSSQGRGVLVYLSRLEGNKAKLPEPQPEKVQHKFNDWAPELYENFEDIYTDITAGNTVAVPKKLEILKSKIESLNYHADAKLIDWIGSYNNEISEMVSKTQGLEA